MNEWEMCIDEWATRCKALNDENALLTQQLAAMTLELEQTKSTMASEYEMDMNDMVRKNRALAAHLAASEARCQKLEEELSQCKKTGNQS